MALLTTSRMRVTRAGWWETILGRWLAVLVVSPPVAMILAVTSGSVAMVVTFLTASITRVCGSVAAAAVASVAVGMRRLPCGIPVVIGAELGGLERTGERG